MADFYKILEIAKDASDDEIKKAYRKLAMQYHPDRNGGWKKGEEGSKLIPEAYDVFRDAKKRGAKDGNGKEGWRGGGNSGMLNVDFPKAVGS